MEHEITFDVNQVALAVKLPAGQVEATVTLLDQGNTIPFITRFRKDQTGGLNENQVRAIKQEVATQRAVIDRQKTIIKSIQSQNKLTDELLEQIKAATNHKRLEDLYLPHRPVRQTLAATARQQGLEPLARDLFENAVSAEALATRALDYVRVDRGVSNVDQVFEGVGHLLAERFSEDLELRERLRELLWKTGKLVSKKISGEGPAKSDETEVSVSSHLDPASEKQPQKDHSAGDSADADPAMTTAATVPSQVDENTQTASDLELRLANEPAATDPQLASEPAPAADQREQTDEHLAAPGVDVPALQLSDPVAVDPVPVEFVPVEPVAVDSIAESAPVSPPNENPPSVHDEISADESAAEIPPGPTGEVPAQPAQPEPRLPDAQQLNTANDTTVVPKKTRTKKKKKAVSKTDSLFKDFFDFAEPVRSIPPHRILAINRGERAKVLRARVESDFDQIQSIARDILVDPQHPQSDFMYRCVHDALTRLILPSLEREIRRELTDIAEQHALRVFAKNLRNLLLQPPLRRHRVVAIDPGYRSGCRYVALDEFGNCLATGLLHIVGKAERIEQGKQALAETIKAHNITAIAIGNGTACRETEKLIAGLIQTHLQDASIAYAIVNEAGASTYSTSVAGREELPDQDPTFRSAISIARRLLDPLSELVKISPENLGIGMYQHDVKAKHLHDQLAEVVESCVNFVGVNVNTASPALLRYVAGLNQLTARRVYEFRQEHGPFRNREQFKSIPGFGEVTFVQSAGFLRIPDGDEPLDATPIHPESYDIARRVLARLDIDLRELVSAADESHSQTKLFFGLEKSEPHSDDAAVALHAESLSAEKLATEKPVMDSPVMDSPVTDSPVTVSPSTEAVQSTGGQVLPEDSDSSDREQAQSNQQDLVAKNRLKQSNALREKIKQIDVEQLASELEIGQLLLRDILSTITRPTRDPRESLPKPIFRREILKIEDLQPGMLVRGRVVNVVDFGAFVDIGLGESSLVHISQLSKRYINDPHEVVAIGDLLKLWVTQVDKARRRITLTAINPQPKPRKRPPARAAAKPASVAAKPQRAGAKKQGRTQLPPRKAKPPKPVKPITKAMSEGREPMRSFSDLQQFFKKDAEEKKK